MESLANFQWYMCGMCVSSIFVVRRVHYTFHGVLDIVVLVLIVPSVGNWVHIPACDTV